jgi:hypothetical protein
MFLSAGRIHWGSAAALPPPRCAPAAGGARMGGRGVAAGCRGRLVARGRARRAAQERGAAERRAGGPGRDCPAHGVRERKRGQSARCRPAAAPPLSRPRRRIDGRGRRRGGAPEAPGCRGGAACRRARGADAQTPAAGARQAGRDKKRGTAEGFWDPPAGRAKTQGAGLGRRRPLPAVGRWRRWPARKKTQRERLRARTGRGCAAAVRGAGRAPRAPSAESREGKGV